MRIKNTTTETDATNVHPNNASLDRLEKFDSHIDEAAKSFGVDKI